MHMLMGIYTAAEVLYLYLVLIFMDEIFKVVFSYAIVPNTDFAILLFRIHPIFEC